MEPFSIMAMTAVGLGLQAFGMQSKQSAGSNYNAAQQREFALQQQLEVKRRQAMELDARRKSLENLRNTQRARSVALTNATNSGASFGSGLQGGYSQISAAGSWNQLGISNNLQIGRGMFDINQQIGDTRMAQANYRMDMENAAGWSQLGQSLMGAAPAFGRMASGKSNG